MNKKIEGKLKSLNVEPEDFFDIFAYEDIKDIERSWLIHNINIILEIIPSLELIKAVNLHVLLFENEKWHEDLDEKELYLVYSTLKSIENYQTEEIINNIDKI